MQNSLNNIYYLSLIITFFLSLYLAYKRINKDQNHIYFYLFFTILNDIIIAKTQIIGQNISIFIYTLFSIGYFFNVYIRRFKIEYIRYLIVILTICIFTFGIFSQFSKGFHILNINFLVGLAIYYIILSLCWFLQKVMDLDSGRMSEDFTFWISSGILLWGCFFIFRVLPTYLFNSQDPRFLIMIQNIFTGVNILTYWILFLGLAKILKKNN